MLSNDSGTPAYGSDNHNLTCFPVYSEPRMQTAGKSIIAPVQGQRRIPAASMLAAIRLVPRKIGFLETPLAAVFADRFTRSSVRGKGCS